MSNENIVKTLSAPTKPLTMGANQARNNIGRADLLPGLVSEQKGEMAEKRKDGGDFDGNRTPPRACFNGLG